MLQSELNANFVQTILYYIDQQVSGRLYDPYGTSVGTWGYDSNGNLDIVTWYISDIAQPSINTLLAYNITDVTSYYNIKYQLVMNINETQCFIKLDATTLSLVPTNSFAIGTIVQDSTTGAIKIWNGTTWS